MRKAPNPQPMMPPATLAAVHKPARRSACSRCASSMGMSMTSTGIGKIEASAAATMMSQKGARGDAARAMRRL